MDWVGKAPVCFSPVKRSSAAAATISPSHSNAAAESNPCRMRCSERSSSGYCETLYDSEFARPLMPRILMVRRIEHSMCRSGAGIYLLETRTDTAQPRHPDGIRIAYILLSEIGTNRNSKMNLQ